MVWWTSVHTSLCGHMFLFLLGIYQGVELLGHIVILCLIFWEIARLSPRTVALFFVPTSNVCKRDPISPHSCQHLSTMCLFYNYSSECEVVTHCGFDLHFLDDKWCWASFHLLIGHWSLFFGDISNQTLCPSQISF